MGSDEYGYLAAQRHIDGRSTGLLVPDLVQATLLLATAEALILLGCLLRLSLQVFRSFYFGIVGFVAVMLNPLLISTLGLEPLLYATLLVACIYAFMSGRHTTLAVLLALLTLTRPDGFLLVPIMLGAILVTRRRPDPASAHAGANSRSSLRSALRIAVHVCGVYLLCLAPWYLFSWIYLGSLVSITLLIKREQGNWAGYNFFNGVLFYYQRYPREVPLTLLLVPFALLCLRLKNRKASTVAGILFLFSSLYFVAYIILGVPPYHWYFIPAVLPWSLLGVLGLTERLHRTGAFGSRLTRLGLYALPCVVALTSILFFTNGTNSPLAQSPIHTNWATHTRFREIGIWLRDNIDAQANIQLS